MTIYMQRIGARVPQNYTIEQALRAQLTLDARPTCSLARAIFSVLTEDQQVRALEQVGWARCPGPAIAAAPAHQPV